jgi:hypothetical protein
VDREIANYEAISGANESPNIELIGCQSVRQVVELPWAADCCPCVGKLRTVLPLTVGGSFPPPQLVDTMVLAV